MPRAVVCLPTYDERENLEPMVRALGEVIDTARDLVLVVDDGSPDGTGEIADRLAAELPWVQVLHRERKEGLGRAYLAAFERGAGARCRARARDRLRLLARPAAVCRSWSPRARRAPTLRSAPATCRAAARATGGCVRRLVSRGGSLYARIILGVARARPHRWLQVLPPGRAGGDRPRRGDGERVRLPDRDDLPRPAAGLPRRGAADHVRRPGRRVARR